MAVLVVVPNRRYGSVTNSSFNIGIKNIGMYFWFDINPRIPDSNGVENCTDALGTAVAFSMDSDFSILVQLATS